MFNRVQRFSYDNTETEYLGRMLFFQERKHQGDWPLYYILITRYCSTLFIGVNNNVKTKTNLSQFQIISLYVFWSNKGEISQSEKENC